VVSASTPVKKRRVQRTKQEAIFETFLEDQKRRYEVAPELSLVSSEIRGFLVTFSQRHRYEEVLGADVEMGVLEDPSCEGSTLNWGVVSSETPIFASPFTKKLASQSLPFDRPIRRLNFSVHNCCYLIQTACRTLGWIPTESFQQISKDQGELFFDHPRLAGPSSSFPVTARSVLELDLCARELVNRQIPYLLGGRSLETGIDCSALSQMLFERHLDILLPRHSGDQRRCGARVSPAQLEAGDVIYATAHEKRWPHIAVVLSQGELVHACRSRGQVTLEAVSSFLEHYKFRGARRIGDLP
jgi:hypothetical protein